ncbi:NnrS family protein [Massilia niastensis]|uniref:NnrS family protein n=1 Tax=Massilia niastensis TaxID=544911 RepID=UPI0003A8B4CC|nr:NnrS family protein [Massilia niastensis]
MPSVPSAASSLASLASPEAPVYRLGFRPFYLLAAALAVVALPAWILSYLGLWQAARIDLLWHMHEMTFGFAGAVVAGFLFTAVQAWTGLPTPHGATLRALAALWLAGRCAALSGIPLLYAIVDLAFLAAVAWIILRLLLAAHNRRNLPVAGVVALLAASNLAFHLALAGWLPVSPIDTVRAAIMFLVLLVALIGGRVAPMFTRNGAPGSRPRQSGYLDLACALLIALATLCWFGGAPAWLTAGAAWCAAGANAVRLVLWDPLATRSNPLLWTIHLSFALLAAGLAALGLAASGHVSPSSALHLLAIGAMGGMIGAMITRTALGHTGRPLRAGRSETAIYVLLPLAALARLIANTLDGALRDGMLALSATFWAGAFLVYLVRYLPYLTSPRADGKPG